MKKFLITLAITIGLVGFIATPAYAATDLFTNVCNSSGGPSTSDSTVCKQKNNSETTTSNSFYGKDGIITKAARVLALVVGIASVIMVIIGGFKYILSNGDSNAINSAKNTILYALIGLVISVIAGAIVQFLLVHI